MALMIVLLIVFPQIALYLPQTLVEAVTFFLWLCLAMLAGGTVRRSYISRKRTGTPVTNVKDTGLAILGSIAAVGTGSFGTGRAYWLPRGA